MATVAVLILLVLFFPKLVAIFVVRVMDRIPEARREIFLDTVVKPRARRIRQIRERRAKYRRKVD